MIRSFICAVLFAALASPALARDPAIGIWQTEPDRKKLISWIEIRDCRGRVCGKILKAFNTAGQEVQTPNIGRELFWDMVPHGDGGYSDGTAFVPLLNVEVKASMQLRGGALSIRACKGALCQTLTWSRVK